VNCFLGFFFSSCAILCSSLIFTCIQEPKAIKEANVFQVRFQFAFVILKEDDLWWIIGRWREDHVKMPVSDGVTGKK